MRLRMIVCAMTAACLFGMATPRSNAASPSQSGNADADRQAALTKMLALLNAPDPAVRLATFELAPSVDRNREIHEALISKDPTLRSAGLASFFQNNKRLFIKIDRYDIERHYFLDKVGGAFNIYISNFEGNRFSFSTVTDFNSTRTENQTVYNLAQIGRLSGDRIGFIADFQHAGISKCMANLMLDQAMLSSHGGWGRGNMSCDNGEHYTIQWVADPPNAGKSDSAGVAEEVIKGVVLLPFALLGWGLDAAMESKPKALPKLSLAERQAEITRDLDQLNSPDPAVRLATLEIAVANGDRTLRHLLLTSAFASSDPILRDAALAGAMAAADNIPLTIVGNGQNNHYLAEKIGGKSYILIRNFDPKSFTFDTITEYGSKTYSSQYQGQVTVPQSGLVSGNRLSFIADFRDAGSSRCNVNLLLDRVGSVTRGIMSCDNNEKYTVESDLLE